MYMPLIRVDMIEGRSPDEIKALLDATHRTLVSVFKIPQRDRYQIVQEHPPSHFVVEDTGLGITRTRKYVVIQVTTRPRDRIGRRRGRRGGSGSIFIPPPQPDSAMTKAYTVPSIDEYLRERLMPVEGAIPHIPGIEMFGNSIPVGTVGGDLFEYINFQQRYDITARVQRAQRTSKEFLEPLPPGVPLRNSVDDHVQWLQGTPGYRQEMEPEYRFARSSEQVRVAEDLRDLCSTAGVLVVDAQGHGIISAKIASTVHDTFHALMLTELDRYGKTTPELF